MAETTEDRAPTLTLADFLLARSRERYEREWDALIAASGPPWIERELAVKKLQGTFAAAVLNLHRASRDLAITGAYSTPLAKWSALRRFAVPYADHPDYREEWRP